MHELEPLLAAAREDPDVAAVLLFGSAARGEPHRDLDVALVLAPKAVPRAFDVRMAYLVKVEDKVDAQVFQSLPLHVRSRVLRDARVLLANDEDELYRVALGTAREWEDFRPFAEEYLEDAGRA